MAIKRTIATLVGGGVLLSFASGLISRTISESPGAVWYGYPFYWLGSNLGQSYLEIGGLIEDIIFWFVILSLLYLLFSFFRAK